MKSAVPADIKLRSFLVVALLTAAFGPYIHSSGLRVEHVVIYSLFICVAGKMLFLSRFRLARPLFLLVSPLVAVTAWTFIVSLIFGTAEQPARVIAAIENYSQPIALIIGMAWLTKKCDSVTLTQWLKRSAWVVVGLLAINAVLAIAHTVTDTWPIVKYFVAGNVEDEAAVVWIKAVNTGRFSGIFGQPFEAGVGYSLALLLWAYLFSRPNKKMATIVLAVLFVLVSVGGALSVSKVFIFGGFPLSLIYMVWVGFKRNILLLRYVVLSFVGLLGMYVASSFLSSEWSGSGYFLRLFAGSHLLGEGGLSVATANRFGEEDTAVMKLRFSEAWNDSPLYGFGFGSTDSALDNAVLLYFYQGGLVGVGFYLWLLGSIGWLVWWMRRYLGCEYKLLGFIFILIIGADLGAPTLTINRSSLLIWVVICLLVMIAHARGQEVRSRERFAFLLRSPGHWRIK